MIFIACLIIKKTKGQLSLSYAFPYILWAAYVIFAVALVKILGGLTQSQIIVN